MTRFIGKLKENFHVPRRGLAGFSGNRRTGSGTVVEEVSGPQAIQDFRQYLTGKPTNLFREY